MNDIGWHKVHESCSAIIYFMQMYQYLLVSTNGLKVKINHFKRPTRF